MFRFASPRITPFIITCLLIGCGGGLLYPLWSKDYPAYWNGNDIFASDDKQSIYVVSGLHLDRPLQILQYDLAGNLIDTHEYSEFTRGSAIKRLKGDQFYLYPLTNSLQDMQLFDLNSYSHRPAFMNYPFEGYAVENLSIVNVDEHNNLIITGIVQQQSEGDFYRIIGMLDTDGTFNYQTLNPHIASVRVHQNANGTGYVIHAITTLDYRNNNGIRTIVMFLDENLSVENTLEYAEELNSAFAFNYALYGRFQGGVQDGILLSIQQDGTLIAAPSEMTSMTSVFGKDHFYQLGYKEDNFNGKREICRFNYEPKRLNCFYLSIEGEYTYPSIEGNYTTNAQVLDDGAFAITEQNHGYVYQSAGINVDNIDDAVLGEFAVKGYYQKQYRQRSVSPEGKLILDSKPTPFKEVGHFEICYDDWFHIPSACLITEHYEAGTCTISDYEFLDSNHLITLTLHCESRSVHGGRINFWQPNNNY